MAGMLELERSRTRRERTFIGSECAVCEEPLEHTLRGERILQFSCGHVSHEACFYEYIKEFDSQYCPTCNAPLGLDTSRGGNVLDLGEKGFLAAGSLPLIDVQRSLAALYDRFRRTMMQKIGMPEVPKIHQSPGNRSRVQLNGQQARDQLTTTRNVTAEIRTPKRRETEKIGILSENASKSMEEVSRGGNTLVTVAEIQAWPPTTRSNQM